MARKKKFRKDDFLNFPMAFREAKEMRGKWSEFYGNEHPLTVEVGCGKGELTLGMAALYPERNFMGLDLKSDRLWKASSRAAEAGLKNVAFHQLNVVELPDVFEPGEVSSLWITFPDPFPRKRNAKRRLSHYVFLREFAKVLKPEGMVEFKTDNYELFVWSIEHFEKCGLQPEVVTHDLYASPLLNQENGIRTYYEQRFLDLGKKINYTRFSLQGLHEPPVEEEGEEEARD